MSKGAIRTRAFQARGLENWMKTVLIKQMLPFEGGSVVEIYPNGGVDIGKWARAKIQHYTAIHYSQEKLNEVKKVWEAKKQPFKAQFICIDPTQIDIINESKKQSKENNELNDLITNQKIDAVAFFDSIHWGFQDQESLTMLLRNVATLLRPGGVMFGHAMDASVLWSLAHKKAEASTQIEGELYRVTFKDDQFLPLGTEFTLEVSGEEENVPQYMLHFPTLIHTSREVGLRVMETPNAIEFFEDYSRYYEEDLNAFRVLDKKTNKLHHAQKAVVNLFAVFIIKKENDD